jgi:serine/threonine-protein kinase
MPYVDGPSLRERLQAVGRLDIGEAVRIASDVAKALDFAHQHGVVHRDIKPENILLSGEEALVTDFGIARAIAVAGGTKLTQTGMTIGTPVYMSPEQARGRRDLDGRSDLYNLACVVYEMLAGHPPFTAESPQELLARHAFDPVPTLRAARPDVPAHLERAVLKALAKVPADRFATVAQFAQALTDEGATESSSGGGRLSQAFRQIFDRTRRPRSD